MHRPSGPYAVGVHDAHLRDAAGGHRVRLFYPAAAADDAQSGGGGGGGCGRGGRGGPARGRARWLPPSLGPGFGHEGVYGAMRYIRAPMPGLLAGLLAPVAARELHAGRDVEMLAPGPPLSAEPAAAGAGAPRAKDKWPLVLFSHGLAGSTGFYSITCIDIASHGYLVAAVEHSDGSALNAFFGSERRQQLFRFYDGSEVDGPEWEFRNKQLITRIDDFDALREELRAASQSGGEQLIPQENPEISKGPDLVGRIDFQNTYVAGHSFGGSTALLYGLRHASDDHCPKRILCIDSWLYPMDAQSIERTSAEGGLPASCEVLFLDMGLSAMEDSRHRRKQFASGTTDFVSVVGALHNNSSDFPAIVPKPIALLHQMTARGSDPDAILAAQCEASRAFLGGTWPRLKEEIAADPRGQLRGLTASADFPARSSSGKISK